MTDAPRGRERLDARRRALHAAIAEKLREDPECVLRLARDNLDRREANRRGGPNPAHAEPTSPAGSPGACPSGRPPRSGSSGARA